MWPSQQREGWEQVYCCLISGAKSLLCSGAKAPTTTGSTWQMPLVPGRTEGFLKPLGLLWRSCHVSGGWKVELCWGQLLLCFA